MRTRNSENPKPAAGQKKTPSAKKSATPKAQNQSTTPNPTPAEAPPPETTTPKSSASKRTPLAKATPAKTPDLESPSSAAATPNSESKMETPVEETILSAEDAKVSSPSEAQAASTTKRVTRKVVRKKVARKTPTSTKAAAAKAPTQTVPDKDNIDEVSEEKTMSVKDVESPTKEEAATKGDVESPDHKEQDVESLDHKEQAEPTAQAVEDVVMIQDKGKSKVDVEELPSVDPVEANLVLDSIERDVKSIESEDPSLLEVTEPQEVKEEKKNASEKEDKPQNKLDNLNEIPSGDTKQNDNEDTQNKDNDDTEKKDNEDMENKDNDQKDGEDDAGEEMVEYGEDEAFIEPSEDDFQEDDGLENVEEVKTSEEEHMELTADLKERKIRKELEVFVGGLDRDVAEDDVKRAFERVGEVVEVRLLKDPSTNRNRGFAFVRFANKEQAGRALSEMKNPVICGKRCGTAPSEDNDVLFLGNICNTWTKEAIKQKLKDYGIEGVESITLVQDPRHEGLSRGFCFVQFACHADAMIAYKRLQKPDAIFGHAERSAKVAFAEPLREPDPEVMAKVKSVFVDGLPPYWDEDRVRESFKSYGEIERITLARNMPSAKRKDFGFVDFCTHEAALACIEDVNTRELGDGNSKARVRARLSNPMPKTQAVKGGMLGGFRVGRGGVVGRGFGRGNRPFERPNFQYGRPGFYQHGCSQFNDPIRQYPDFHDRWQFDFGGWRGPIRGHHLPAGGSGNMRNNFSGPRQGLPDRGLGRPPAPVREPFFPEDERYSRPYMGRYMDNPYMYDDRAPGMKRPFQMADQDPGYMEPSRVRPRFDYSDPARGNQYRENYGASSSMHPGNGYYGSDYGGGPGGQYPPFRGNDRSFRGGGYY